VLSADQALTYLKRFPLLDARPFPVIKISRVVALRPGLGPVVQVTEVEEAALTGQSIPSIKIE
jgi:hypothetical protein